MARCRASSCPEMRGQTLLARVWAACKEGVTRGLVLLYEKDPQNVSRILDVCQVSAFSLQSCMANVDLPSSPLACCVIWCHGGHLPCSSSCSGHGMGGGA